MAARMGDAILQLQLNQGLFLSKAWDFFRTLSLIGDNSALLSFDMLSSIFCTIYFIELLTGQEAMIVEMPFLVLPVVQLALKSMIGINFHLASYTRVKGVLQVLVLSCFALMINGAHADDQNEDFQSWTYAGPNISEIHHHVKAAAIALLAGLLTFRGAFVVRRMFNNNWSPVEEPNEGLNEEQVEEPAPEAEPALPIIPFVEGNDFDDVMERTPVANRRNSPLGWL